MSTYSNPEQVAADEAYHQGWDAGYAAAELACDIRTGKLCARLLHWCARHGHTLPPALHTHVRVLAERAT